MSTAVPASRRQLDTLECSAAAFLLLPLLIFFASWLRWPWALALLGLAALSSWAVLRQRQPVSGPPLGPRVWALMATAALLWVLLSGLLGPLALNTDWFVRLAVLRDLSRGAWPVGYGAVEGGDLMLRFSLGYYVVPALAGKLLGDGAARLALGLFTGLGVLLFFALAVGASTARRAWPVAAWLLLLIAFSGMDVLGYRIETGLWPVWGQHIEWWGTTVQYSSQTTLLFWAPNHALPAWLVVGIVWRHRDSGLALAPAALLLMAAAIWSPLACVGLAPLVLWCSARRQRATAWLREGLSLPVLAVLPGTALIAKFVTFGVVERVATSTIEAWTLFAFIPDMAEFAFIEWATLAVLVGAAMSAAMSAAIGPAMGAATGAAMGAATVAPIRTPIGGARRLPGWFWVSVALLAGLPLLRYGPGNDLVMRAGIAPLTMLMLAAGSVLFSPTTRPRWRAGVLTLLLLGSVTPALEISRATLPGGSQWHGDGRNVAELTQRAWHYVGLLGPGWIKEVLRPPVPLPPDGTAPASSQVYKP